MEKNAMTEAARAIRNEYARKWRRANPDKARAAQRRYWEKKAAAADQGKGAEA